MKTNIFIGRRVVVGALLTVGAIWPACSHAQPVTRAGIPVPEQGNAIRGWTLNAPGGATQFQGALVRVAGFDTEITKRYVVLELRNGQRRSYPLELFSEADRAYVRANAKDPFAPNPDEAQFASHYTDYARGEAGVNTHATPHFLFYWGDTIAPEAKNWNDAAFREMNFAYFEDVWNYFENVVGAPMPYAGVADKYKTNVYITGTGLSKHPDGFAFGGLDIIMHPGALLRGSTVVPHEFGHTLQLHSGGFRDNPDVGWFWETHANWGSQLFAPSYPPALDVYAERMHYELSSSRMNYGSWPFLEMLTEDPRFGSTFCWDIWTQTKRDENGIATETPFETIMRLGVERGVWQGNGTAGFGDIIGQMAARNVTWDYINQYSYQTYLDPILRDAGRPSWDRTVLHPVSDRAGWFAPTYSQTPRQYGVNIVDLQRAPGAGRVEVNFDGIADESEGSDWRVTLVAVDADGHARYSPMWHTGKGSMDLQPGETVSLAIAATPTIYRVQEFRPGYNQKRRFSYEVSFAGATPVGNTHYSFARPTVAGAPHANGGGFVADSARVDDTAYVGPNAAVLENARVTGDARIEDDATILGDARVSDEAIVSGHAVVRGQAQIGDDARVRDYALIEDNVKVRDNARVTEFARVHGDGAVGGLAFIKGFGDVYTSADSPIEGTAFLGQDLEVYAEAAKAPIRYGLIYGYTNADQLQNESEDYGPLTALWNFDEARQRVVREAFADDDGILRGSATFANDGERKVLKFNGQGYVAIGGDAVDSRDITFDFDLKWAEGTANQRVFEFGAGANTLYFTPRDETDKAAFVIKVGTQKQFVRAANALPANRWERVTITLDGDNATLRIGDSQTSRKTVRAASAAATDVVTSAPIALNPQDLNATAGTIGAALNGSNGFNGELDDLAIYRAALTGEQLAN